MLSTPPHIIPELGPHSSPGPPHPCDLTLPTHTPHIDTATSERRVTVVFCTQQRLNKWQLVKFSNLKQRIQYTPCKQRGAWTVKTELSFPKGAGIDRMVVHAYNSRTWEVLKFKGRLGYIIIPCLKKIKTKIKLTSCVLVNVNGKIFIKSIKRKEISSSRIFSK